jgi:hypothetical protein
MGGGDRGFKASPHLLDWIMTGQRPSLPATNLFNGHASHPARGNARAYRVTLRGPPGVTHNATPGLMYRWRNTKPCTHPAPHGDPLLCGATAQAGGDRRACPCNTAVTCKCPTLQHGHIPTSILATRAMKACADSIACTPVVDPASPNFRNNPSPPYKPLVTWWHGHC